MLMLTPFAPHIAEELWEAIGEKGSILACEWPAWSKDLARDEEVELVVQVNGKLRAKILVPAQLSDEKARELALQDAKIKELTAGRQIRKIVVVRGKLVNIVL
jgi:leucyl-tRNA synthetase